MTANPLMLARKTAVVYGAEALEAHVAKLNNCCWVNDSGKPYFVAQRELANGTVEYFVDRRA